MFKNYILYIFSASAQMDEASITMATLSAQSSNLTDISEMIDTVNQIQELAPQIVVQSSDLVKTSKSTEVVPANKTLTITKDLALSQSNDFTMQSTNMVNEIADLLTNINELVTKSQQVASKLSSFLVNNASDNGALKSTFAESLEHVKDTPIIKTALSTPEMTTQKDKVSVIKRVLIYFA